MRVLLLNKRQYTAKDLLDDRYGRLFEIPAALVASGHEVRGLALSYRRRKTGWYRWDDVPGMDWYATNAWPGLLRYSRSFSEVTQSWRPDILWASSDALHAVLGARLSRRHGIPLVVDLYDNYESFGLTRLPGLLRLFRRACRDADGITLVSKSLERHVVATCRPRGQMRIIGNGVRKDIFFKQDKLACRKAFGLPLQAQLIGTAGALTTNRGIGDLLEAFQSLAKTNPDVWLVCAGPRDAAVDRFSHPRFIDLGVLTFEQVPKLLNALDVAVVYNRDSAFGRYCFPLKFHEIIACEVPVVAAAVGDVADLLQGKPAMTYLPGDVASLVDALQQQLRRPVLLPPLDAPSWKDLSREVAMFLRDIVAADGK